MIATSWITKELLKLSLAEDLGHGDITSSLVVDDRKGRARIVAKESFVLAGMPFFGEVFALVDEALLIQSLREEGSSVEKGAVIATLEGDARSLLAGERLSLNILQRLSGIATATAAFAERVRDLPVRIVDTRKTTPGMRQMEKYAVAVGGGSNHRFGLYDGILIKDNHIALAGGVRLAIERARKGHHLLKIEVEVGSLAELGEALDCGADVIMLDNMPLDLMAEAVRAARAANPAVLLEASGNVTLERVRDIALTGVDIISAGGLTHSVRAADISMLFEK